MTQKNRANTRITSVSVTKEFLDLVKNYNLSPSEVYRRGVAVSLSDMGIKPYDNPLNKKRFEEAEKFIKEIQRFSEIKFKLVELKRILEELNNF